MQVGSRAFGRLLRGGVVGLQQLQSERLAQRLHEGAAADQVQQALCVGTRSGGWRRQRCVRVGGQARENCEHRTWARGGTSPRRSRVTDTRPACSFVGNWAQILANRALLVSRWTLPTTSCTVPVSRLRFRHFYWRRRAFALPTSVPLCRRRHPAGGGRLRPAAPRPHALSDHSLDRHRHIFWHLSNRPLLSVPAIQRARLEEPA